VLQYRVLLHELRQVHNHYPGSSADPGRWNGPERPTYGFKFWVTDEPSENHHPCYCGWLDGREHFGTVGWVDEHGECWSKGRRVKDLPLVSYEPPTLRDSEADVEGDVGDDIPWE
jgi:hypothetical protein